MNYGCEEKKKQQQGNVGNILYSKRRNQFKIEIQEYIQRIFFSCGNITTVVSYEFQDYSCIISLQARRLRRRRVQEVEKNKNNLVMRIEVNDNKRK